MILGDAFIALRPLTDGFNESVGKSLDEAAEGSSGFGSKLGKVAKDIAIAGGVALVAIGAIAVDSAAKFQEAQATLQGTADITAGAANAIGDAFLATAGKSVFSATTMVEAYGPVAAQLATVQGHALNAAQAVQFVAAAGDLAEASGEALSATTSDLAAVMQAYGIQVRGAATASNILFNTSRLTGTGVDTLSTLVDRLKGKLGDLAPTLSDVSSTVVDLAEHDVSGARGVTVISGALENLLGKASTAGPAVTKALQSAQDAATNTAASLAAANLRVKDAQMAVLEAGYPTIAQTQALQTAQLAASAAATKHQQALQALSEAQTGFGSSSASANVEIKALGLQLYNAHDAFVGIGGVIAQLQPKLAAMREAQRNLVLQQLFGKGAAQVLGQTVLAGVGAYDKARAAVNAKMAVEKAAAAQLNTFPGILKVLKATIEDTLVNIGKPLLPVLSKLIAAILPVVKVLGGVLTQAFSSLIPAIQSIVPFVTKLLGGLGDVFAHLVEAVAPALAALGHMLTPLIPVITTLADSIGNVLGQALSALMPSIQALIPVVVHLAGLFTSVLIGAIEAVLPPIFKLVALVGPVLGKVLKVLGPIVAEVASALAHFLGNALNALLPGLGQVLGALSPLLPALLQLVNVVLLLLPALTPVISAAAMLAGWLAKALSPALTHVVASGIRPLLGVLGDLASHIAVGITWVLKMRDPLLAIAAVIGTVLLPAIIGWGATQAETLIVAALGWALYAARWVAEQAEAAASFVATNAATLADFVATQATALFEAAGDFLGFIAEHAVAAAGFIAQNVAMAAASVAAFVAENAATLGIVAGLALLVAGIVWVATHWKQTWDFIKDVAASVWHFLDNDVLRPIEKAFESVIDEIKSHWKLLGAILLAPLAPFLIGFELFHRKIIAGLEAIGRFFVTVGKDILRGLLDGLKDLGKVGEFLLITLPKKVLGYLSDAGRWLLDTGAHIIDGLIKGLLKGADKIGDAVKHVGGAILHGFKDVLGIFSPSTKTDPMGRDLVRGLVRGFTTEAADTSKFTAALAKVLPALRALTRTLGDALRTGLGPAGESTAEFGRRVTRNIDETLRPALRVVERFGRAVVVTIVTPLTDAANRVRHFGMDFLAGFAALDDALDSARHFGPRLVAEIDHALAAVARAAHEFGPRFVEGFRRIDDVLEGVRRFAGVLTRGIKDPLIEAERIVGTFDRPLREHMIDPLRRVITETVRFGADLKAALEVPIRGAIECVRAFGPAVLTGIRGLKTADDYVRGLGPRFLSAIIGALDSVADAAKSFGPRFGENLRSLDRALDVVMEFKTRLRVLFDECFTSISERAKMQGADVMRNYAAGITASVASTQAVLNRIHFAIPGPTFGTPATASTGAVSTTAAFQTDLVELTTKLWQNSMLSLRLDTEGYRTAISGLAVLGGIESALTTVTATTETVGNTLGTALNAINLSVIANRLDFDRSAQTEVNLANRAYNLEKEMLGNLKTMVTLTRQLVAQGATVSTAAKKSTTAPTSGHSSTSATTAFVSKVRPQ